MSEKKRTKLPPSKVIVTMGEKLTQTQFSGEISTVNLLNAIIHLFKDTQKMSGMGYKEMFSIVDEGVGGGVFRKKPTMNASLSDKTANTE